MKILKIFLLIVFLSTPVYSFAEDMDFYETIDASKLPKDVQNFIKKENNCYIISDQPSYTKEEMDKFLKKYKCDTLCCTRQKLLSKYEGDEVLDVIKDYNSSMWRTDFAHNYENCGCDK